MADVQANIIAGSQTVETSRGIEDIVVYDVTDLPSTNPERNKKIALENGEVPQYGQEHKFYPGLRVVERRAKSLTGPNGVRITCVYRPPNWDEGEAIEHINPGEPVGQIEVSAGLQEVETYWGLRDEEKVKLEVYYTGPDLPGPNLPYWASVRKQIPLLTARYRRREMNIASADARNYIGHTNSNSPMFGAPQRTWLCTDIHRTSYDGGVTYDVTYEFQRAEEGETWDATIIYLIDGRPAQDVNPNTNNGIATYQIYPQADFRELGLVFI